MTNDEYAHSRRNPTEAERAQAEANKALIWGLYDLILRPQGPDFEGIETKHHGDYLLEIRVPHPHFQGQTFKGLETMPARVKLVEGIASDSRAARIEEVISDGPHRVVGIIWNEGTDVDGNPWKMNVFQVFDVVDGKVAHERVYFENAALLSEIISGREAVK